jgi:DNA-binding HxlR family transcriptional regulator
MTPPANAGVWQANHPPGSAGHQYWDLKPWKSRGGIEWATAHGTPPLRSILPNRPHLEILGDRWTPLILRELMLGVDGFNRMARGLPAYPAASSPSGSACSNAPAPRLSPGRQRPTSTYQLTAAGNDFTSILDAMAAWDFGGPWRAARRGARPVAAPGGCARPPARARPGRGLSVQFEFRGRWP